MEVMWLLLLALLVSLLVLYLVIKARKNKEYFTSKNVAYLWDTKYRMFLGVNRGTIFLYKNVQEIYSIVKRKANQVAGVTDSGIPTFVVQDPEMIKNILVKDFDHFPSRRTVVISKNDTLLAKMLVSQKGDSWKDLRTKMSPTFTTGKIKRMFQIMKKSGDSFVKFLESEVALSEGGEVELSTAYSKMTMDVIASAVCGIDSKVFETREESVFEQMGNKFRFEFGGFKLLKFMVMAIFPKISDLVGLSFFSQEVQDFFRRALMSSIKHRQETGEKRDDFIQLLLEVRANKLKAEDEGELLEQFEKEAVLKKSSSVEGSYELDDDAIVANCVLFIIGGFDTTQSLLLYGAYAMALWPEKQEKLRQEVDKVFEDCDSELTYEAINKMEYLDMFVNGKDLNVTIMYEA